jgi:PAS domain S-box-containing protein
MTGSFDVRVVVWGWRAGEWGLVHAPARALFDLALVAACFSLAGVLGYFAWKRRQGSFRRLFWLSCAFLLAIAAVYLVDTLSLALDVGWLATLTRVIAAVVAWTTLAVMLPLVPRLLALRSRQELEAEVERSMQHLRDSEAQVRAIVDTAADGILTLDEEGRVQSANRACSRLFGLEPEEMVGQQVSGFLAAASLAGGGIDRALVRTGETRILGPGEEAVGRRADGTTFPAGLALSKTRTPNGRLLTVIVHDLTGPKKTEEALRHSEARLRTVLNQVPAILCSTDSRLRITLLTCSAGTGLSGLGQEMTRFTGVRLGSEESPPFLPEQAFARALQGESVTAELAWEERTLEFHIEPLRSAGVVVGTVGVGLDVTERKRAETAQEFYAAQLRERNEQLSRSNQELDEFAYVASHDLKEPLRGIHNYASFLIEDHAERLGPDGRAKLETLKQLTQRMDALIDSLLQFSRVGRVDLAVRDTDLNEVVDEVLASLQINLETTGVKVRFARDLPVVRCDRVRIAEVFRNLVSNAIKYNNKSEKWVEIGGKHIIPGEAPGGENGPAPEWVFHVRDNGIGIPPQHREAVFRIFKRLHGRDKFGGGTGAGLTIVKKIVERHGGRIWIDSTPGEGTTFSFTMGEPPGGSSRPLIG